MERCLSDRNFSAGLGDGLIDSLFDFNFGLAHDRGNFRNQKESRAIQHALFTERQGFYLAEVHQVLEYLGHMEDGTGAHPFRVFLESVFPVACGEKIAVGQVGDELVYIFPFDDLSEADIPCVCGGNHNEDIVGTNPQKVKSLKLLARNKAIGNFFDYSNTVVGVDDLVSDFKWIHSEVTALLLYFCDRPKVKLVLRFRKRTVWPTVNLYRRVLIVRACAIGDFVLNLPVLRALSLREPNARFTLVGYPETLSLAKAIIPVEAIHSIESPPWASLFAGPVPGLDFDAAWVWMKDPAVADHLRESGVGQVFHAKAFPEDIHAAEHLLSTASLPMPDLPDLWREGSNRVILHPGSGSPSKCWPWFEELAEQIPDSVVLTGPGETQMRTNRPRLHGLGLQAVAEEIRSCRAFIGNDSGITHLAAYWGSPTIALFGPTNPRIWGPVGRRVTILWKTPLSAISVDEVRNHI